MTDVLDAITVGILIGGSILPLFCAAVYIWSKRPCSSGSVVTGVRVDVRAEMRPTIVADCRNVPLPDESFDFILADPPYSEEYARDLYGTFDSYPRPGQIVREACRLLRPGGRFGLLHFQVPMGHKPMAIRGVYGVTTGSGYAIRAWTLMEKGADELQERLAV